MNTTVVLLALLLRSMYFANAWLAPKKDFAILICANLGQNVFQATDETVAGLIHYAETLKRSSP